MFIQLTLHSSNVITDPDHIKDKVIINTDYIMSLDEKYYGVILTKEDYKITKESFNYLIKELGVVPGV